MNNSREFQRVFLREGVAGLIALVFLVLELVLPGYFLFLGIAAALVWLIVADVGVGAGMGRLADFLRRAKVEENLVPPRDLPPPVDALSSELEELLFAVRSNARDTRLMADTLRDLIDSAEAAIADLAGGFTEERSMTERANLGVKDISGSFKEIASHVETLAEAAEESSSSILEMTTTNEEVAENMTVMANSVRDTVSSIDEMAYSIKEAATNIDALSSTAEGTSSAMNEMDISIDQVQSNAKETAAISAEVARDAERGSEAITKTLEAINRIKDSSRIAVDVISNLGKKIEAIGQILNVIDDVAEQTNLLALNAAIIAAQAGEHGKGFAVVADEIKELAERSGVSTKEIAELIKSIQAESRNAIAAVEQGKTNVDEGVKVSAEAEQALKQILESSKKSTAMINAIARATVEQSRGSKQVTDAISRIAETVQQIATATAEQARGSELIISGAEKMRSITQHVERSTTEQAKGGRQVTRAIESISKMVNQLNVAHRQQQERVGSLLDLASAIDRISADQEASLNKVKRAFSAVKDAMKAGESV